MAKGQTTISDFAVAPRRGRSTDQSATQEDAAKAADVPAEGSRAENQPQQAAPTITGPGQAGSALFAPSEDARRERSVTKALQREDSRVRLRDLKRARDRESKHYVNCPLDYDTKKRLERAALENDVKMTVIMKAAIDQFLRDNGY
ncbi:MULTISPECIES: hypothetical protein [Sinorhizobium]|uniref:hypothetical protein n=1 Tax=Sinorhizobium TaxID=28105 RepID=UPI000BE90466|nr:MULTISPECIES: hypothetical protein [Sinorhizobium]PDT50830.1 hypothetical protein CO664_23965 [Sinorhizobium sp. NG07B]POH24950.1 hypothetical protein ATY30_28280 [Sinorhizobium americanum]